MTISSPSADLIAQLSAGWDHHPVHAPGALPALGTNDALVMKAVVAACELERQQIHPTQRVRCFVGNARIEADLCEYLPVPGEALSAYRDRMRICTGDQGFGLVTDDLERTSFELWSTVRRLLRPIVTGHSPQHASIGVFLGDNPTTGFGVHRDPHATLMVVIHGTKILRLWPHSASPGGRPISDYSHSTRYEAIQDDAVVISANPGDVVYWPASYFHIAENPERSLSLTLNVALGNSWVRPGLFMSRVREQWAGRLRDDYLPHCVHEGTIDRTAVASACEMLETQRPAPGAIERGVITELLRLRTTVGLSTPPAPGAPRLTGEHRVVIADPHALAFETFEPDLVIAANGHLLELPAQPHLRAMLEQLAGARVYRVGELCRPTSSTETCPGDLLRTTLQHLANVGSLRIIDPTAAPAAHPEPER